MAEQKIVTLEAMQEFVDKFKKEIYDWDDPSGDKLEEWSEKETTEDKKYKIKPVTKDDINDIVTENNLNLLPFLRSDTNYKPSITSSKTNSILTVDEYINFIALPSMLN